jgi:hypothetical protein
MYNKNNTKVMVLDQTHLKNLKDPKNMGIKKYYVPEGYNTDHNSEYHRHHSITTRSARHNPLEDKDPMRCNVAINTLTKALSYKFKLKDINKYSQTLNFKDINWKLKLSALGKKIPDIKKRKEILIKNSHLNTLKRLLKGTDWS